MSTDRSTLRETMPGPARTNSARALAERRRPAARARFVRAGGPAFIRTARPPSSALRLVQAVPPDGSMPIQNRAECLDPGFDEIGDLQDLHAGLATWLRADRTCAGSAADDVDPG